MTFGQNLKYYRTQLKMNQSTLGQAIGVGQTTIANYEKGVRFPTGDILKKIGETLKVSIDDLMGHEIIETEIEMSDFNLESYIDEFRTLLIEGEEQAAIDKIQQLNPSKDNLLWIYEAILVKVLYDIGILWEKDIVSVAVEHFASQVIHKIISRLSAISSEVPKGPYNVVCMSFSSEPHTIGMRMISEFFNLKGWTSYYIGTSVPTDSLIAMLKDKKIHVLALSATMDYHLDGIGNLIEVIKNNKALKHLKIIVGGQAFCHVTPTNLKADGLAMNFDQLESWLKASQFSKG